MDPITLSYVVVNARSTVTPLAPSAFSGLSGVIDAFSPLSPLNVENRSVGERQGGVGEEGADVG